MHARHINTTFLFKYLSYTCGQYSKLFLFFIIHATSWYVHLGDRTAAFR
jgi:hypothetical protein